MKYGRPISPNDESILKELKHFWKDSVKIDFDITHEPCIFYNYYGAWNIVYKLSKNGSYIQNRWTYAQNAHKAILSFLNEQNKISMQDERKFQDNFFKRRSEFSEDKINNL